MGFGPCWVDGKSIACLEVGPQRGFAQETLGEPSTFKLWQTGHNSKAECFLQFSLLPHPMCNFWIQFLFSIHCVADTCLNDEKYSQRLGFN